MGPWLVFRQLWRWAPDVADSCHQQLKARGGYSDEVGMGEAVWYDQGESVVAREKERLSVSLCKASPFAFYFDLPLILCALTLFRLPPRPLHQSHQPPLGIPLCTARRGAHAAAN